MALLKTPPLSPSPHATPPSPMSIWTPVDEELEALSLGWDDCDKLTPKCPVRSITPPTYTADPIGFNSRGSKTDPRPKRDKQIDKENSAPRRRLSLTGQQVTSGQPQQLQKQLKAKTAENFQNSPENSPVSSSAPLSYIPSAVPVMPQYIPQPVTTLLPQQLLVPQQLQMQQMQQLQQMQTLQQIQLQQQQLQLQAMQSPNRPTGIQMVMSPQHVVQTNLGPVMVAGQAGNYSPVSFQPYNAVNAVLVPAEADPNGQSLYRLMPVEPSHTLAPVSLFGSEASKIYCLVEFKRGRTVQYESSSYITPGQYVIVGGDRGEDLGMVVKSWAAPQSEDEANNGNANTTSNKADKAISYDDSGNPVSSHDQPMGRVIRLALTKEVYHLHNVQTELEKRCTEFCQQKVTEHGLIMEVVDAEYQFDRKKLTFYYNATERQDFRDLVRDLYKTYRARIWMAKAQPSSH